MMIAVIFEVWPTSERRHAYLEIAAGLRRRWPRTGRRKAGGRNEIFADYRLRVAGVIRDYGMADRTDVPDDRRKVHG